MEGLKKTDMEIIHLVLGKANPERMNGVNKVVFQLASKQTAAGRKVSVWGITKDPVENYGNRNFETQLFRAKKNSFSVDHALREALIAKKGKAVFHLHGGWIPVFFIISGILNKYDIPFVITPHGAYNTIAMQRSKWIKKLHFHLFEKVLLSRAGKIHCIGQSEVTGTNCLYPTDKTFLLPYGFEPALHYPERSNNDHKHFVIGFMGRLDIYTKGLDLLVEAFEFLQQTEKNSILWIVGDGKERESFEKMLAEKNLANKVIMWGGKFGKEKDELLSQMDVFAHPSRNEGLPAAILEASAMGIPSVVTNATNVGKFIDAYDCGMTVENENPAELAKALLKLKGQWNRNELAQKGEQAKRMVNTEFSWKKLVHDFDALYQ